MKMFEVINDHINLNTSAFNSMKFPDYFKDELNPEKQYLFSHLDNWFTTNRGILKHFSLKTLLKNEQLFGDKFIFNYLDLRIDFCHDSNLVNKLIDFKKTIRFINNLKKCDLKKHEDLIDYAIAHNITMEVFSHLKENLIIKVKIKNFNDYFKIKPAAGENNHYLAIPKNNDDVVKNIVELNDLLNSTAENIKIYIPEFRAKINLFKQLYSSSNLLVMGEDKELFKEFKKQFKLKRKKDFN